MTMNDVGPGTAQAEGWSGGVSPAGFGGTAAVVAVARAIGITPELRDPLAAQLMAPDAWSRYERYLSNPLVSKAGRRALRVATLGLIDHNTARMLAVDTLLGQWLGPAGDQVVILGAGLDLRAWRLPALAKHQVYELDLKSVQDFKRDRLGSRAAAAGVTFLPVDFQTQRFGTALQQGGFVIERRTMWICEGVSAYLAPERIAAVLAEAGACSGAGSRLVLSYVTPAESGSGTLFKRATSELLRRLGERVKGQMTTRDLHQLVESAGLAVEHDWEWKQWARFVPGYSPTPNPFKERLLVARPLDEEATS